MSAVSTDTMGAFVMRRIGEAALTEKPILEPRAQRGRDPDDGGARVHSDMHTVKSAIPVDPNVTLGHEAVGIIHALGVAVEGFS